MDRRDTHASADRRDPRDARDRRGASSKRKRKNHGRGFKAVMTVVLILVITMVMLLCMAAIYIKNVIIPEASLEMADFNPNLTSTMYYKDRSPRSSAAWMPWNMASTGPTSWTGGSPTPS